MSKKYRVFHLIKGLGRGGAERLLSEGLGCADLSRFVYGFGYFLPWKDALVSSLRDAGAEVTCFQSTKAFTMISFIAIFRYLELLGDLPVNGAESLSSTRNTMCRNVTIPGRGD
jgi:hypothetical protein